MALGTIALTTRLRSWSRHLGRWRSYRLANGAQQTIHIYRLCEEVHRTMTHRLNRRVDIVVARENNKRKVGIGQPLCPIRNNKVEGDLLAHLAGEIGTLGTLGREALELQPLAQIIAHAF